MPVNANEYLINREQKQKEYKEIGLRIAEFLKKHKGDAYSIDEALKIFGIKLKDDERADFFWLIEKGIEESGVDNFYSNRKKYYYIN